MAWNVHLWGVSLESVTPPEPQDPPQRVVKIRRDYNNWVASETMEDYALNEPFLCITMLAAPKTARTIAVQHLKWRISWGMHVA